MTADPYEVLGVQRGDTQADIRKRYLALVRQWHPDVAGPEGTAKTAALNLAYNAIVSGEADAPPPRPEPEPTWGDDWGEEVDVDYLDLGLQPDPEPEPMPDFSPRLTTDPTPTPVRRGLLRAAIPAALAIAGTLWAMQRHSTDGFSSILMAIMALGLGVLVYTKNRHSFRIAHWMPRSVITVVAVGLQWLAAYQDMVTGIVLNTIGVTLLIHMAFRNYFMWHNNRRYIPTHTLADPSIVYGSTDRDLMHRVFSTLLSVRGTRLIAHSNPNRLFEYVVVSGTHLWLIKPVSGRKGSWELHKDTLTVNGDERMSGMWSRELKGWRKAMPWATVNAIVMVEGGDVLSRGPVMLMTEDQVTNLPLRPKKVDHATMVTATRRWDNS